MESKEADVISSLIAEMKALSILNKQKNYISALESSFFRTIIVGSEKEISLRFQNEIVKDFEHYKSIIIDQIDLEIKEKLKNIDFLNSNLQGER